MKARLRPPDPRDGERDFHGIGGTYSELVFHAPGPALRKAFRTAEGPRRSLVGCYELLALEIRNAFSHRPNRLQRQGVSLAVVELASELIGQPLAGI